MQMDGDMTYNVLLSDGVRKMLSDPLALSVVFQNENYITPNRFISHWCEHNYCWNVPIWFQKFTDPISSIYLSQALFKTILQLLLIFAFASLIQLLLKRPKIELLFISILITPFFQTFGFNRQMGIIDQSMTYDFFYALPILFVIVCFYPLFKANLHQAELKNRILIMQVPAAFIVAFSGPLNPGIAPIICLLLLVHTILDWKKSGENLQSLKSTKNIKLLVAIFIIMAMCLYSLYVNHLSNLKGEAQPSVAARYGLMLDGIIEIFSMRIGLGWLFAFLGLNLIISKFVIPTNDLRKTYTIGKYILAGSILYLLLLPMGGYRAYRELVIRYDTFLPITIAVILLFVYTTYQILLHNKHKLKYVYYAMLAHMLIYFTQIDKIADPAFDCEKRMLEEIATSDQTIVKLSQPCSVIGWEIITDYKKSEKAGQLLQHWNVTKDKKYFYYAP